MKLAEKFFDRLIAAGDSAISKQRKSILSSYRLELVNTINRVSEIKNLIYRSKAAKLNDIFVEPTLSHDDDKFSADDVFQKFLGGTRIIIRGSAGLGKSVLLKHFCLCHVQKNLEIAPLFLELRKLDGDSAGDIVLGLHEAYNGGPNARVTTH